MIGRIKFGELIDQPKGYYVIVKPHDKEDNLVITRGRGVNNKDILRVQVGFNWLLSQHGFYTTCL